MCVCVCVTEVGSSGGGTIVVTQDIHTYTSYCICVITSERTRGATTEEDADRWSGHNRGAASWSGINL